MLRPSGRHGGRQPLELAHLPYKNGLSFEELEPRSFSFNSPFGACPECTGIGTRMEVDPELVVADPQATLGEGVIQPWSGAHVADYFLRLVNALGEELARDRLPAPAGDDRRRCLGRRQHRDLPGRDDRRGHRAADFARRGHRPGSRPEPRRPPPQPR